MYHTRLWFARISGEIPGRRRATRAALAAGVLGGLLALATPAPAIVVGINIDVHQNLITTPDRLPNDFHIRGRIESGVPLSAGGGGWSDPPVLVEHVDDLFVLFSHTIMPDPADPQQNWYLITADWSGWPVATGIPFCTVLHLGLFFDVTCHNVIIDVVGTWTRDGQPIGHAPTLGFAVRDQLTPLGQMIRLQNGDLDGVPDPGEVELLLIDADLVTIDSPERLQELLGPSPFRELRVGGLQESLPWVQVWQGMQPVSPMNPIVAQPDSFFDVFLSGFEMIRPETPMVIPAGGFLLARQLMWFTSPGGEVEQRWIFEIHEAHRSDLGDAPDGSNSFTLPMTAYAGVPARFPTVFMQGSPPHGPIHWSPRRVAYLGYRVSAEFEADIGPDQDPQLNLDPFGDLADTDGADDSVVLPLNLPSCAPATLDYRVTTVSVGTPLFVNAWFDWNRDGDWDDVLTCPTGSAAEWAVQNQPIPAAPTAGTTIHTSTPFLPWHPPTPGPIPPLWMRITLSERPLMPAPGIGFGGAGPAMGYRYGETEDYLIEVLPPVYVKWSQPPHEPGAGFDAPSGLWWLAGGPIGMKWLQLPNAALPGLHAHDARLGPAYTQTTLADQWVCRGDPVSDVHWWGNYELDILGQERRGAGIRSFVVSVHANLPALPWCLPLMPPLLVFHPSLDQVNETATGIRNAEGSMIYAYRYVLPQPFEQAAGETYWVDLSARANDPQRPAIWRWQEAARGPQPIICPAAAETDGSPWRSLMWPVDPPTYSDLAFAISVENPAAAVNRVVADDFWSDGRPIRAVRWWGSYLDPRYAPDAPSIDPFHVADGWLISFHPPRGPSAQPPCPPDASAGNVPSVLGVYFAAVPNGLRIRPTGFRDCLGHEVYQYEIDLANCLLICSELDPRTERRPAQPDHFAEEFGLDYWLDIQAVVGVRWETIGPVGAVPVLTGHLPSDLPGLDGQFWGWHSSAATAVPGLTRAACAGRIVDWAPYPPNCWSYGDWQSQPWLCPTIPPSSVHLAFELVTDVAVEAQACCLPTGECVNVPPLECIRRYEGTPQGEGSRCDALPPRILAQPLGASVCEDAGATVELTVVVCGAEPLNYQWRKDGIDISGATEPTLTLAPAGLSDAGSYDCVIGNGIGLVSSDVAELIVWRRCDSNCDHAVNFNDINAFVEALISQSEWEAHYSCDYFCANDTNRDGTVDFDDIDAFVVCLVGS